MKIQSAYDIIKHIESINNVNYHLYFTEKSRSGYTSYEPNTTNSIKDRILELILLDIRNFNEYPLVQYNPIGNISDVIEFMSINDLSSFKDLIKEFTNSIKAIEDSDIDKLTFYTLYLNDPESQSNIYLFRRTTKFKKLYSKGFFGNFHNNTFNEFDSKLIGVDGFIDIVVIDETAYIFNHIAPERIFKMNEQYNEIAMQALCKLREKNRITNFDEFEEDCLSDLRIQKIFAKLCSEESLLDNALNDFAAIRETIDLFGLELETDRSDNNIEKLVYPGHDKQALLEILRIIRDVYYISTVNHRQGIDALA